MAASPFRIVRAAATVAAAAVLTLITGGPAPVAAGPPDRLAFAERIDLAGAVWLSETETSSTVLEFRIFDSDQRSDSGVFHSQGPGVVLFFTRTETDPATGIVTETNYEGFSGGSGATFDFQRSLGAATADVSLTLYGFVCTGGPAGIIGECEEIAPATVDVHIEWTGVGPVQRNVDNTRVADPPGFMFGAHTVQALRDAEAVGTIAGPDVSLVDGPATFGVLLRGKYHEQLIQRQVTGR